MVALAVRTFGQKPVVCYARPLLFQAHAALDRGSIVEAGCLLREAARLYALAECEYFDCVPSKPQRQSPTALVKALKSNVPGSGWDWLIEAVGHGNRLAHCQFVSRSKVEASIAIVHLYLDCASYLIQPTSAGRLS